VRNEGANDPAVLAGRAAGVGASQRLAAPV
jgi:hypothetical protein